MSRYNDHYRHRSDMEARSKHLADLTSSSSDDEGELDSHHHDRVERYPHDTHGSRSIRKPFQPIQHASSTSKQFARRSRRRDASPEIRSVQRGQIDIGSVAPLLSRRAKELALQDAHRNHYESRGHRKEEEYDDEDEDEMGYAETYKKQYSRYQPHGRDDMMHQRKLTATEDHHEVEQDFTRAEVEVTNRQPRARGRQPKTQVAAPAARSTKAAPGKKVTNSNVRSMNGPMTRARRAMLDTDD